MCISMYMMSCIVLEERTGFNRRWPKGHCCYLLHWRKGPGLTGGDDGEYCCYLLYWRKWPCLTRGDRRGVLLLFIVVIYCFGGRDWVEPEVIEWEYCCYLLLLSIVSEEETGLHRRWSKESIDIFYWSMLEYMFMISGIWIWLLWYPNYEC